MKWKIRAEAPTIYDECNADTEFWEEHRDEYKSEVEELVHFRRRALVEKRAQAILVAEYDSRFGPNAWAASGKKFPKDLKYYNRPQLARKVYELKHGHPLPKIKWRTLFWAVFWTAIIAVVLADVWVNYPTKQAYFHGFRLAVTVFVASLVPAGILWYALEDFYPLRERKFDKLIAWHAKSPVFILLCSVIVGVALISGGAAGLGWLFVGAAAAYAIWYCLLVVLAVEGKALGCVLFASDFIWPVVGAAIRGLLWPVVAVAKLVWKVLTATAPFLWIAICGFVWFVVRNAVRGFVWVMVGVGKLVGKIRTAPFLRNIE